MLTSFSKQRWLTESASGHAPQPHTVVTNKEMLTPSQIISVRHAYLRTSRFTVSILIPSRCMKTKAPDEMKLWYSLHVPSILYFIYLRIHFFLDQISWLQQHTFAITILPAYSPQGPSTRVSDIPGPIPVGITNLRSPSPWVHHVTAGS